ncbi:hypothetical protein QLL95_gp0432 [Cotonvirus japonicus]|uniref:Uncharacterized protein n=1 Tax=Cotonvirus japonicus TaxID=2811091 RepID=A0ABM7NUF2_9VIRU|nr:hypothetical protein QLL95_gp0432 [Cotonvirus japonicus]BCS83691.1 hypothetical protein [Cotonvirus japonicus]
MNSATGSHQVIAKLFANSDLPDKTINFIQVSIQSQMSRTSPELEVLYCISQYLDDVPEENFSFIESTASTLDKNQTVECIRIPTLISELTDGGRLSKSNKIDLGNKIKTFFCSNDLFKNRIHSKVLIQTKSLQHGRIVEEVIPVVRYTRKDLIYMIVLVWRFILQRQDEICY